MKYGFLRRFRENKRLALIVLISLWTLACQFPVQAMGGNLPWECIVLMELPPHLKALIETTEKIAEDRSLGYGDNSPEREKAYRDSIPNLKHQLESHLQNAQSSGDIAKIFPALSKLSYKTSPVQDFVTEFLITHDFESLFVKFPPTANEIQFIDQQLAVMDKNNYHARTNLQGVFKGYFEWRQGFSKIKADILSPSTEQDAIKIPFCTSQAVLLQRLPANKKRELNQLILAEITRRRAVDEQLDITLKQAQGTSEYGNFWKNKIENKIENKNQIRSLEFYHYQLNFQSVISLTLEMAKAKTTADMVKAADKHFQRIFPGGSLVYSFSDVISVARVTKGIFSKALSQSEYLEIFGSFANGKARVTSDIDVRFNSALLNEYLRLFGKDKIALRRARDWGEDTKDVPASSNFYEVVATSPLNQNQKQLIDSFSQIEDALSAYLHRPTYSKTKLFAVSAGGHETEIDKLDIYQTFSIRIYSNQIVIRIHINQPGSLKTAEFILPDPD
jgi:hypothetical protein